MGETVSSRSLRNGSTELSSRQHRQSRMEFGVGIIGRFGKCLTQIILGIFSIVGQIPDDRFDLRGVGLQQTFHKASRFGIVLSVRSKAALRIVTPPSTTASHAATRTRAERSPMHTPALAHHLPLRLGPLLLVGQQSDVEVFPPRRQEAVFRLGVPSHRRIEQFEFRPALAGFLLLASQPVPQRMHQIIVRQLKILLPCLCLRHRVIVRISCLRDRSA